MTGLIETRVYRTGDIVEGQGCGELEHNPEEAEVLLAEQPLHPSLDEIFLQIDAAHKRGDEWLRQHFHPAHARHGSR